MKFHSFLLAVVILLVGCKSVILKKDNNDKPNIIVILIDDAGYVDFGFMGSKDLETPNIDKLAKNGVVLTDAHVTSTVCAPSRAGLISGKYQQRFGFEANGTGSKESGEIGLADDVVTIADVFQQNNYKTIALGKWHLGFNSDDHPNQRGFDEFFGFLGGSRSYFPLENVNHQSMLQKNGERVKFEGYLTDILGERAVSFVEENREQPFFMYLAFNAVHTPMHAKEEHLAKYEGHPRQKLAAMTWSLDENVGKLIDKLESIGQLNNTLIFFLSDNGGATTNQSINGPLKGFKGNKFEAGHRVPFIVHWPDKIRGNKFYDGLSSSLDIFKTSIAAADIKEDEDWKLDGVNLIPYLKGEKQTEPHSKLFWRKLGKSAVRIGDDKLIKLNNYGSVLYNLKNDLGESNDLSKTDTLLHNELIKELESWDKEMMRPLWEEGDYWKERNFEIHKNLMKNKFRDVKGMNNLSNK
ncbi:sulfatase-like hydrolase/transferase [Arenibacter certesii]|uniref:Arylsulfatase n=1 Tax=Arenibacter certesii TaxID=228955 RepID=A0A918IXV6_9FLAO|nr:sulfatase-like hydrolase/transferase [Arenibacter certesii]GGW35858.1 arylsulfatase [Arenibacter certesii]